MSYLEIKINIFNKLFSPLFQLKVKYEVRRTNTSAVTRNKAPVGMIL